MYQSRYSDLLIFLFVESPTNTENGFDPSEKLRSNIQKQIPRRYGNDDANIYNGTSFDGSSHKSHKRYSSTSTTSDSKKYDDSTPPPRTRMNFSYGAKDEEIIELQKDLDLSNKRTAAASSQLRCKLKLFFDFFLYMNLHMNLNKQYRIPDFCHFEFSKDSIAD